MNATLVEDMQLLCQYEDVLSWWRIAVLCIVVTFVSATSFAVGFHFPRRPKPTMETRTHIIAQRILPPPPPYEQIVVQTIHM